MNTGKNKSIRILLALSLPLILACAYLDNLIKVPEPKMEENVETVLEVLNGEDWVPLQALAPETYTEEDFAKPDTLTFTANVTNDQPVYFNYGWCTTTEEILRQNFEHIDVQMYFNEGKLGNDVVHNFNYTLTNGQFCSDFGVLFSEWPAGEYHLRAVVTFDEKINDGMADYEAGDYIFDYTITVEDDPSP